MSPSEVLQVFAAAVVMSLYRSLFFLPVVTTKHVNVVCGGWGVIQSSWQSRGNNSGVADARMGPGLRMCT